MAVQPPKVWVFKICVHWIIFSWGYLTIICMLYWKIVMTINKKEEINGFNFHVTLPICEFIYSYLHIQPFLFKTWHVLRCVQYDWYRLPEVVLYRSNFKMILKVIPRTYLIFLNITDLQIWGLKAVMMRRVASMAGFEYEAVPQDIIALEDEVVGSWVI